MMTSNQQKVYEEVKASFPETFSLRAFPSDVFRISDRASYFRGWVPDVHDLVLYTERLVGDEWVDFAKGSVTELRAQVKL